MALQSAYALLSLSYESLFLLCLSATLWAWLELEREEAGGAEAREDRLALAPDRYLIEIQ